MLRQSRAAVPIHALNRAEAIRYPGAACPQSGNHARQKLTIASNVIHDGYLGSGRKHSLHWIAKANRRHNTTHDN